MRMSSRELFLFLGKTLGFFLSAFTFQLIPIESQTISRSGQIRIYIRTKSNIMVTSVEEKNKTKTTDAKVNKRNSLSRYRHIVINGNACDCVMMMMMRLAADAAASTLMMPHDDRSMFIALCAHNCKQYVSVSDGIECLWTTFFFLFMPMYPKPLKWVRESVR